MLYSLCQLVYAQLKLTKYQLAKLTLIIIEIKQLINVKLEKNETVFFRGVKTINHYSRNTHIRPSRNRAINGTHKRLDNQRSYNKTLIIHLFYDLVQQPGLLEQLSKQLLILHEKQQHCTLITQLAMQLSLRPSGKLQDCVRHKYRDRTRGRGRQREVSLCFLSKCASFCWTQSLKVKVFVSILPFALDF